MEFLKALLESLQGPLLTLIEASVAAAVPFLLMHLNAWMKARSHDARFHCAMDKLTTHAESAILDTAATFTKAVRAKGGWNGDAANEAKERGMARFSALLGPAGLAELKGCLGHDGDGVKAIMESSLEGAYVKLKQAGVLPPKVVVPKVSGGDGSGDA